jgi:hypothetical protein
VQAPRGKALIITRSTGDKQKASVPFFREIIIPQWDIDAIASSVKLWDDGLTRPDTITRFTDSDYTLRTESINEFFGSSFVDEPENKAESVDSASDEETESIGLAVAFLQQ